MNNKYYIKNVKPAAIIRPGIWSTGIFRLMRLIVIITLMVTTGSASPRGASPASSHFAGMASLRAVSSAIPGVTGGGIPRAVSNSVHGVTCGVNPMAVFSALPGVTGRTESDEDQWTIVYSGEITGKGERRPGRIITDLIFGSSRVYLNKPMGVTAGEACVWILNQGDGRVLRMSENRAVVPPAIRRSKISYPSLVGITMTDSGHILFTDSKLNKVFSLSPDGRELNEFNSGLVINQPTGIAFSAAFNEVWIVETASHRITVTDTRGNIIRQIGGRGTGNGEFNYPTSVWIDNRGVAYVVDALNFRVQIFDHNGTFISAFGKQGDATGSFARPKGIAVDSYGHIYVTDALFNAVQVFDKEGHLLHYFGTQGRDREQFWLPAGIFIDEENNIYIADSYNSRIQVFRPERRSLR